jgi:hypothetical protein
VRLSLLDLLCRSGRNRRQQRWRGGILRHPIRGAFLVGGLLGAFIAILRANPLGGAALGLLAVVIFVSLWALGQGDVSSFGDRLVRAVPFAVWFSIPSLVTGLVVAWLRMRRERKRVSLTPGQPV